MSTGWARTWPPRSRTEGRRRERSMLAVCPAPGEISLSWFCLADCVTPRSGGEEITARTKGWCVLMQTVSVGPVLDQRVGDSPDSGNDGPNKERPDSRSGVLVLHSSSLTLLHRLVADTNLTTNILARHDPTSGQINERYVASSTNTASVVLASESRTYDRV